MKIKIIKLIRKNSWEEFSEIDPNLERQKEIEQI